MITRLPSSRSDKPAAHGAEGLPEAPAARRPVRLRVLPAIRASNLTQRGVFNAVARGLDYFARVAVGFVLQPMLVAGLGNLGYGIWQILQRMVGYTGPASGRPGQALRWTIASRQASTDFDDKRREVANALVVWCLFLPLMLGLGAGLAWFVPLWLKVPAALVWPVRLTTALLVLDVAMGSLSDLPRSVLEGENLGYKRMGWSATLVIMGGVLLAVALLLDWGLVGVAVATLVATVITGVFFLQVVRTHVPWFGVQRPVRESARRFLGLSGWFLSWNLITRLLRSSDVVLLGLVGSVTLVTDYTLTKYVPETLTNLVAMGVFGVTPGLGGILGSGDLQKAVRVRDEIMSFSWLVLIGAGTTILLWNQQFIALWVGSEYSAGSLVNLLIVLMVMQFVLFRNDANIIDLTLDLRAKVFLGLASTALSIAGAWALMRLWDASIVGLCLGFIFGRGLMSLAYPWLVGRRLGIPLARQLRSTVRPGLTTVAFFGAAAGLSRFVSADSWPVLIAAVAGTVALMSLASFYAGLSATTRWQLWRRVQVAVRTDRSRS